MWTYFDFNPFFYDPESLIATYELFSGVGHQDASILPKNLGAFEET
jgi:hypothetical protein